VIFAGFGDAGGTGTGDENVPTGHRFKAERSHFADIFLVIDDQNASGHFLMWD
jgi:hypothetical protein